MGDLLDTEGGIGIKDLTWRSAFRYAIPFDNYLTLRELPNNTPLQCSFSFEEAGL
jgi:hypothetical protein